jgi:hypothetical protein
MEEIKKELQEIINAPVSELTKEHVNRIREIAGELGVSIPKKTRCKFCWMNIAVECFGKIKETESATVNETAQTDANKQGCKYVLKPYVDLFFGSLRINAATITDELAEQIIKDGFDKRYFEKC